MSYWVIVRHFGLLFTLFYAVAAGATTLPQVAAESKGIGVSISNWTPFPVRMGPYDLYLGGVNSIVGPGFPSVIPPYHTTGTGVYLEGGVRDDSVATFTYQILNGTPIPPTFGVGFSPAVTDWDLGQYPVDIVHAAKKAMGKRNQIVLKRGIKKEAKVGLEAVGMADGMTEAYLTYKVITGLQKLYPILKPEFHMSYFFYQAPYPDVETGTLVETPFADNACIVRNENSPAAARVSIVGPPSTIGTGDSLFVSADNAESFFVLAASSSSHPPPGSVDITISPICDYVCATWNATNEHLDEYSMEDCDKANIQADPDLKGGKDRRESWDSFDNQNWCLTQPADGYNGVPWVQAPPVEQNDRGESLPDWVRLIPEVRGNVNGCQIPLAGRRGARDYGSICGPCLDAELGNPAGSWSDSCNLESFTDTTLCADCANNTSSARVNRSCASCPSEVWNNDNGTLSCDTSPPPGTWVDSCTDWVYNGSDKRLCATCYVPENPLAYSESCRVCSSNYWVNQGGQLICAPGPADESASNGAPASASPFTSHRLQAQFASAPFVDQRESSLGVDR